MFRPRFSLKTFLIATVIAGAAIALQVRVEHNVDSLQNEFKNKDFELHAVTGPGNLLHVRIMEFTNSSSPLDYLLFRRTYCVKYEATKKMHDRHDFYQYQCFTQFRIGVSTTKRICHEQEWTRFHT